MREELLKFIQKWNPNVFEVLDFELKQDDDENGFVEGTLIDKDEDGVWEIFIIDSDENGKADQAYLDNDGDKKPDVLAHDYNEDGEWDKFEELS